MKLFEVHHDLRQPYQARIEIIYLSLFEVHKGQSNEMSTTYDSRVKQELEIPIIVTEKRYIPNTPEFFRREMDHNFDFYTSSVKQFPVKNIG